MNMIVSENFAELRKNPEQNAEVSRLTQQWEKKLARHGKQATGLGMVAFSLAACGGGGGGSTPTVTPPPTPVGGKLLLSNLDNTFLVDPAFWPTAFGDGGAVQQFFANITSSRGLQLTPTSAGQSTTAGDDHIVGNSGQVNAGFIDGGAGDDTLEINLITEIVRFGSVNVETLIVVNGTSAPITGGIVDLFAVFDVTTLVIDQGSNTAGDLNIVNVRDNPDLEFTGHFSADVRVEMLGGIPVLNVSLNSVTSDSAFIFAHEGGTVNLTSQGGTAVNIVDNADLGDYLHTLNIDGATALELGRQTGVEFRATSQAVIDASGASGGVWIRVADHSDVSFTGGAGDDSLSVAPALVAVSGENMITLDAAFGAGDNVLIIDGQDGFLGAGTTLASSGSLALHVTSNLDVTRVADLSAIDEVFVVNGDLVMEMAQVDQIGIDAFQTNAAGATTGSLVITNIQDGALIDLSAINVNTVVELMVGPGDVTLDAASVLGNANAGVGEIVIDVRGQDSALTLTGAQFNQLQGSGTIGSNSGTAGTNNPATNQPYEGALTLVDVASDGAIVLSDVSVDTTVALGDGFAAGADFDITGLQADLDLTLEVSGAVDLSAGGAMFGVDTISLADGAALTISDPQAFFFADEYSFEGAATITGDTSFEIDTDAVQGLSSAVDVTLAGTGAGTVTVFGAAGAALGTLTTGADISNLTVSASGDGDVSFEGLVAGTSGSLIISLDAGSDGALDLGELSATAQSVTVNGTGDASVELATIPAGAAWVFTGTELVINSVAGFGAGSTIHLGSGSSLALGDGVTIADVVPFLTSTSLVPLDATSTAAELHEALQAMSGEQAVVNVTGMTPEQLQALTDNHLKVDSINGALAVSAALTDVQITRLALVDNDPVVATINATGMSTAQKAASEGLANSVADYTVTGLSLDGDDSDSTITTLMARSANASVPVNAGDMDTTQKAAVAALIEKVAADELTNLTVDVGDDATIITALLSKAPDGSVTVDETGGALDQDDFTAIYEQIDTIAVIENWAIGAGETEHLYELEALLPLAVDAVVDAFDMSNEELSLIAGNIGSIKDESITNLTVSADQTAEELGALLSKAAPNSAIVDLSDMSPEQVAAVVDNADHVASVTVGVDSEVTLTLAQLATLDAAGLTPIKGADATSAGKTGGSVTIVADANGTLDLEDVGAGAATVTDATDGTLTLQVPDGVTLTLVGGNVYAGNLAITGAGTVVISESLDLSGLTLSVDAGIELMLPAEAPADQVTLELHPDQAHALAEAGVTINRPAAVAPAVAGIVVVDGGDNGTPSRHILADLNFSLVDTLTLQDPEGTVLSGNPANLPALIDGAKLLVVGNTNWVGYTGEIASETEVASNATLTISAATAAKVSGNILGLNAAAGETGGSIVITDLPSTEIDLSAFSATAGGVGDGTAGSFTILVDANVALHEDTLLPPTATVVVNSGVTLTVEALREDDTASLLASADYTGGGTVEYVGLNDDAGVAEISLSDAVRFSTVVFENGDENVVINDWKSANIGNYNGSFLFDGSTEPDTLGLHSLDLSAFTTNGSEVVRAANFGAIDVTDKDVGIVIIDSDLITDSDPITGLTAGEDAQFFFAMTDGSDVRVYHWNDANDDAGVTVDELSLVVTLTDTSAINLGSENFII